MPNKGPANNDCMEWKVRWAEQQERKIPLVRWLNALPTYLMRVKSELKSTLVTGDNHRRKIRTQQSVKT